MEERERLRLVEPNTHAVPHGDRSNVVIEPYLTDQWYVNVKPLAERALQAVRDGQTRFVPENYERTFFQWLENIEPWCISRQLWWGHQIPVWYDEAGGIYVATSEAEAQGQADAKRGAPVALRRDEDVLDTWFSSALWPFSTLGWPDDTPGARALLPDRHAGDRQGHHLLLGRPDDDARPPRHRPGAVRDGLPAHAGARRLGRQDVEVEGQRRRSARTHRPVRGRRPALHPGGHGGAGTRHQARGEPGRGLPQLRDEALERLALRRDERLHPARRLPAGGGHARRSTAGRSGEAARAVAEVTAALDAYRFNDAAAAAYRFVWNIFCDWYLELAKPVLQGEGVDAGAKAETQATVAFLIDQIAKLLHPFMPFLTEELWAIKGEGLPERGPARPGALAGPRRPERFRLGGRDRLARRPRLGDPLGPLGDQRAGGRADPPRGGRRRCGRCGPARPAGATPWSGLARLSEIRFEAAAPKNSVQLLVRGSVAALPLEGIVDLAAEVARLKKEAAKAGAEIAKIEAKLGNADFLARAPDEVVDEQRERRDAEAARLEKITEALARLAA